MKLITLADGSTLPALGLGTWKSAPNEVYTAIRQAIEIGYTHFDCAHAYDNEAEIGRAFADAFKAGDTSREKIWITSKLWNNSHKEVAFALERTLKNLQLDYLDLYLIHWNVATKPNASFPPSADDFYTPEEAPLTQTWADMCQMKEQKLTKHIGISNMAQKSVALLESIGQMPEMIQAEAHPHLPQTELVQYCQHKKIGFTAYCPLASRQLSPLERPQYPLLDEPLLNTIAERHNATPAQIAIAWALQRGTCTIPKSTHPEHLQENFNASKITLSDTDMSEISLLDNGVRYVTGVFFTGEGSPYSRKTVFD